MTTAYSHTPRPIGGAISFELREDRLTVDVGRKAVEIPLASVEEVRMTYEPRNLAQKAFRTRLRLKGGRSFSFTSVDWKSRIDARSLDREYRAFTRTLLDAVARANPQARFVAGRSRAAWIATAALAVLSLVAMVAFTFRALQAGATAAAALAVVVALIGIWQLEPMVRLNKPRSFTPDEPPPELMP